MKKMIQSTFRRFIDNIWSLFLSGLLTLLPIALTIGIFNFTLKILKNWLQPIYEKGWLKPIHRLEPSFLHDIHFSELVLVVAIIILVGLILRVFLLRSLLHAIESLLNKVPLVRTVYSGIKQLVDAFNPHDKVSFKQVVLIEFPRKGIYSVGFMTSELAGSLTPEDNNQYMSVFVPTTPNPTTGYFFIVAKDQIFPTDLSRQEAMALIISGGIIQPERFIKKL
ncbi:MAG: DUF502 domain-containing protein [Candidatus Dependentiae bacterium]